MNPSHEEEKMEQILFQEKSSVDEYMIFETKDYWGHH